MSATVLLVGLGGLGRVVLEFLAREKSIDRIVVASRNQARGVARCNLARLSAMAQGYSPNISFVPIDLNDAAAVAELVHGQAPDVILNTASLQTWRLPDLLPPERADIIKGAGFGVWLPVHLTLTLKLMQALRDCAYSGLTLSAPFPDVVNCILGRLGLAPTCGVGNLDEIVPKVRLLAAERLAAQPESVRVFLVAHHALGPYVFGRPGDDIPPYFLRVEHEGQDVTAAVQADALLLAPYPITPGMATHFLTAGSTIRLILALFSDQEVLLHAPGPGGLPGGYPIVASRGSVQLAPIKGLTLDQAIAINEQSHRFDGIEAIAADGTVVFRPEAADVLRVELGYDCSRLKPEESAERADELMARFWAYAERYGVSF